MECKSCTLCCTLLNIESMKSPAGKKCEACNIKCTIYEKRPNECKKFDCLWLTSPILGNNKHLRPDRCGVIFELFAEEMTVIATTTKKWKQLHTMKLINQILRDGYVVWIMDGDGKNLLLPKDISEKEAHNKLKSVWRRQHGGS